MNIGIVTAWFERGAGYVSKQYKKILETQHQVFIFARGGEGYAKGDPNWDIAEVTWSKPVRHLTDTALDLAEFRRWLIENKIDLVLFNEQRWWPPVLLCNEMGILTGAYIDYYTEETIDLFGCYDFLICNTQRHMSVFDWHPQSFYLPWGTDINAFKPQTLNALKQNSVTFFHSSGMSPRRKGTDLVIRAFAKLPSNTILIIHAQNALDKDLPELSSTINELRQTGRLQVIEQTVPAPGLYHLGDVYVYPTRLEGIGLTLAEAQACGLPAITTDNPPMNEFIDPDVSRLVEVERLVARPDGYYWPQAYVKLDSLSEKMLHFVENVADLSLFKRQTREYAVTKLNWDSNAAPLLELVAAVQKSPRNEVLIFEDRARGFERKRISILRRSPVLRFIAFSARDLVGRYF
jgi:glycosyltransferase involved in cell wall biosynthesis